MTTQGKIDILERMIPIINTDETIRKGICWAAADVMEDDFLDGCIFLREEMGIVLPPRDDNHWCWPLTPEGDEQRREFLRSHIERLKKEL